MNYELSIPQGKIASELESKIAELREPITRAMGTKFLEIVHANFGQSGIDRPQKWAALSNSFPYWYATKVGRPYATLIVTGALYDAVKMESKSDSSRVYVSDSEVPYATDHQFGNPNKRLPARPYFPIDESGQVTEFTQQAVQEAAQEELLKIISGVDLQIE